MPDYYTTLGVSKSASQDEIKKAYRKLAHQHHPDKKNGDEQKFKKVNEAYQILSDPKKRAQYDQFGSSFGSNGGPQGNPFGGGGGFEDIFRNFRNQQAGGPFNNTQGGQTGGFEDIFDIFGDAFGFGQRRSGGTNRGADIQADLMVNLYDVARGSIKKVEIAKDIPCQECRGSGVKKGSELIECSVCKGAGETKETMGSVFGSFTRVQACNVCQGKGKIPKENCQVCKGEGKKKDKQSLEINIPAGIRDGEALGLKEMGQAGFRGQPAGDLYIRIRVAPDRRFKRVGNDIFYETKIKLTDAILGATISIPTLDGEKELNIPAGTQDGQELRMKGIGVHGRHGGDQIVKANIEIPKKLSGKAKKLVEELSSHI